MLPRCWFAGGSTPTRDADFACGSGLVTPDNRVRASAGRGERAGAWLQGLWCLLLAVHTEDRTPKAQLPRYYIKAMSNRALIHGALVLASRPMAKA